jgi:hypothetical protein
VQVSYGRDTDRVVRHAALSLSRRCEIRMGRAPLYTVRLTISRDRADVGLGITCNVASAAGLLDWQRARCRVTLDGRQPRFARQIELTSTAGGVLRGDADEFRLSDGVTWLGERRANAVRHHLANRGIGAGGCRP